MKLLLRGSSHLGNTLATIVRKLFFLTWGCSPFQMAYKWAINGGYYLLRWGDPPSTNGCQGFVRRALVDAAGHFAHESPLVGMPWISSHLLGGSRYSQHMCVNMQCCIYIYADLDMYVYIYIFMCLHVCFYICIHLYVFTDMFIYISSIYIYIFACLFLVFYICYISFTYHTHHYTSHISYMYISYLYTYVHIYRQYVSITICSDRGLDCRDAWLLVKHVTFMYSGGRCYTIHPWAL